MVSDYALVSTEQRSTGVVPRLVCPGPSPPHLYSLLKQISDHSFSFQAKPAVSAILIIISQSVTSARTSSSFVILHSGVRRLLLIFFVILLLNAIVTLQTLFPGGIRTLTNNKNTAPNNNLASEALITSQIFQYKCMARVSGWRFHLRDGPYRMG